MCHFFAVGSTQHPAIDTPGLRLVSTLLTLEKRELPLNPHGNVVLPDCIALTEGITLASFIDPLVDLH